MKPTLAVKAIEYLQKHYPKIVNEAVQQIEKPEADFNFFFTLLQVFHKFCEKKDVSMEYIKGEEKGNKHVWDRTVLLAIVFKLYSPEVFIKPEGYKEHCYNLRNGLREELAGMLECHPTWISQRVGSIVVWMEKDNYTEFRTQVNDFVQYMKHEIHVKEVEKSEPITLFQ